MSEFSSINTPSDLVEFNKSEPESTVKNSVSKILDLVYAEDPEDGLFIVNHILGALADYHRDVIKHYTEEEQCSKVSLWAYDLAILDQARNMIKDLAV